MTEPQVSKEGGLSLPESRHGGKYQILINEFNFSHPFINIGALSPSPATTVYIRVEYDRILPVKGRQ
jgi:hypothetical protein